MGRKKRGRRRRRSEAAQLAAEYNERRLERELDDVMAYQAHKKEHTEHAKIIAEREKELLSRTIFVTNVKDLRNSHNLSLLKVFFQRAYGPVEHCVLASHSGKSGRGQSFPKARLRFKHERDAKAIFGGTSLSLVESPVTLYDSMVGHRGNLRVFPSKPYQGMDESPDENKVILFGDGAAVGHYCPLESDENMLVKQDNTDDLRDCQKFLIEDEINYGVTFSINIGSRMIEIRLRSEDYKLCFPFKDLQDTLSVFKCEAGCFAVVLRLKHPPKIYELRREKDAYGLEEEVATRCLEMGGVRNETFGSCYGYLIRVSSENLQPLFAKANRDKLHSLKRFGLIDRNLYAHHDAPKTSTLVIRSGKNQVYRMLERTQNRRVGMLLRSLMDNGRFSWYHALYDTVATPRGMKNIFELVDCAHWIQALSILESMSGIKRPTSFPAKVFYAFLQAGEDTEVESNDDRVALSIPEYCTLTPRLLLTPTRLAVVGFSVEMSNRVVRHFISSEGFAPECFLRVTIGEENGARLFSDQLSYYLCLRIEHLILNGFSLNGYTYRFLAYSSSQLKESSLWMVNTQGSWTVESIRRWMGDFSMCETPSKVAARMGQCFSTTVVASGTHDSVPHGVKDNFPDVLSNHNGKEMCHSDGTGLIERSLLEFMTARLPLGPDDPTDVSIIQIRFGGAKGTLAGWDFSLLRSLGRRVPHSNRINVLLRPSMVKFKAPYRQLEIISFGMKIPYYLNRNVILLLKVHGVQDEIFLKMQRQMLNDLDDMLIDSQKAMEMIPRLSGPDSSLSSALVHMLFCGLTPTNEPFLFSCLHAIRAHHLMNLRKKSRVFVDKGAVLTGGLDETGLVPEGCVFVQINKGGGSPGRDATRNKSLFEVLDGPIMVTKHPVVHPGDVRMLLAVDIPELRSHKNVILFSQHGSRPEADKMAGSDLDGDQFAVTWDERLFLGQWNGSVRHRSGTWTSALGEILFLQASTRTEDSLTLQRANKEPMDFVPDSSENILSGNQDPFESMLANAIEALLGMSRANTDSATNDNAVNDKQLLDHFINHAKNDNLGHIATMWLDYANKNGADCEECLKLAALHSIAVDFPKSGKPAQIPRELYISRSAARAHWREKKGSPSYDCKGALGRMYDEVVNKMQGDENRNSFTIPLAGRRFDSHGQILRFVERRASVSSIHSEIYKPQMAIQLGLNLETALEDPESRELELLSEAMDHRDDYEQGLISLMSKYGLQCEGELLTGCIRKYHKLDKKRQHDLSEAVRGQCRELKRNSRQTFFLHILYTVCPDLYQEDAEVEEDEEKNWVECIEATVTGKVVPPECSFSGTQMQEFKALAFQLAAAYYEITYNTELWWNEPSSHKRSSVLFSFPWIVADVMAFGLGP